MPNDDGRLRPLLAESWSTAPDGLSVTVRIFPNAKFHDGTSVTGALVAEALNRVLPQIMGPAFDDVKQITGVDATTVRFDLRRRSQFILESLETAIQKPGKPGVGTGPYVTAAGTSPAMLKANPAYYRERPSIEQISVTSYPSVRAAWAELLRGNLDMLSEVNIDALDSLQRASNVSVFSYVRHYQYMIVFSPKSAHVQDPLVRRALNAAINRDDIIRVALNGHGVPSTGPVPPEHWALDKAAPRFRFDRNLAKALEGKHLKFTCLVPADSAYERVALAVKEQLAASGVDMEVEDATQEQILRATSNNDYDAVLLDPVSGPTVFRSYRAFYSKVPFNPKPRASALIDDALDRIREAQSDDAYRAGVTALQQAMMDDPPVLFIAWGERARAVSRRFEVPAPEKGRDVLNSIRLWRPSAQGRSAN